MAHRKEREHADGMKSNPFAMRLQALRKERGLTQLALAVRMGCSKETIASYERGVRSPTTDMTARLSAALHLLDKEREELAQTAAETHEAMARAKAETAERTGGRRQQVSSTSRQSSNAFLAERGLDLRSLRMGSFAAATSPYALGPVRPALRSAVEALLSSLSAENTAGDGAPIAPTVSTVGGVVIIGHACAGKTRLAFEAVRMLTRSYPDVLIVRWEDGYELKDLPSEKRLKGKRVLLWVDDVHHYALGLGAPSGDDTSMSFRPAAKLLQARETLQRRVGTGGGFAMVATCRAEYVRRVKQSQAVSWLFEELAVVQMPEFSPDPSDPVSASVIEACKSAGTTGIVDPKGWNGRIGSLYIPLARMGAHYAHLAERYLQVGDPTVLLLRAMLLLTKARTWRHTEPRLRSICAEVYREPRVRTDQREWERAVTTLLDLGFVREKLEGDDVLLEVLKDSYLEPGVMDDYPDPRRSHQLALHLSQLRQLLLQTQDSGALLNLAIVYSDQGDEKKALTLYEETLAFDPDNFALWYDRAITLRSLGQLEDARASYEAALRLNDTDPDAWNNLGTTLRALGRDREAWVAFRRAVTLEPKNARNWANLGAACWDVGRRAAALGAFMRANLLDPDYPDAWNNMAVVYRERGQLRQAAHCVVKALRLQREYPQAWSNLSRILARHGHERWASACRALSEASAH